MEQKKILVLDGKDMVLGRLASYAAKQALLGKEIIVVNCNEIVITGRPRTTILEYKDSRQRGGASLNGPFFPKYPERIVKRTIRGMLSYKQGRGRDALKEIKCYNEIPPEFEKTEKVLIEKPKKGVRTIKLKDLSKEI